MEIAKADFSRRSIGTQEGHSNSQASNQFSVLPLLLQRSGTPDETNKSDTGNANGSAFVLCCTWSRRRLLSGILGVGGGQVVVPGLLYIFHLKGVSPSGAVHLALGTSLATIVVTSCSSALSHNKRGAVDWMLVGRLVPAVVVGAVIGGLMSALFSAQILRIFFGTFLLILALQMAFSLRPSPHWSMPGVWGTRGAAGLIGWTSAIVGVGGGSMVVPFLVWCNVNMKTAVGTAAACGAPLALAGMIGFLVVVLISTQT